MARLWGVMIVALALALAGCNSGGNGGGGAAQSGDSGAPLVTDMNQLGMGAYTVQTTGDVTFAATAAQAVYNRNGDRYEIAFLFTGVPYEVRLLHFGVPASGQYPLTQSTNTEPTAENPFSISLLSLSSPLPADRYLNDIQGTLNLVTTEFFISGSFDFTAASEDGSHHVTVHGIFSQLRVPTE